MKNRPKNTEIVFFLNVCCVLVFYMLLYCSVCFYVYRPFCHGALKIDIKLMKGKALRKHSLHEKTAASVLLKLFISSNE